MMPNFVHDFFFSDADIGEKVLAVFFETLTF
jgi:hypothetical protein